MLSIVVNTGKWIPVIKKIAVFLVPVAIDIIVDKMNKKSKNG